MLDTLFLFAQKIFLSSRARNFIFFLCTLCIFSYRAPIVELIHDEMGILKHVLYEEDHDFIEQSREKALKSFVIFSAMKAALAIMESSRVGISFFIDVNVEVGRFFQSMKHLIDYAWQASGLGILALTAMDFLLSASVFFVLPLIDILFFGLATHFFLSVIYPPISLLTEKINALLAFLLGMFAILIPISIYLAFLTSQQLTHPIYDNLHNDLESNHSHLIEHGKRSSMQGQAQEAVGLYRNMSHNMEDDISTLSLYIFQHIALLAFDVLIFPFGFFYCLFRILKKIIIHFFLSCSQSMQKLEKTLVKKDAS